MMNGTAHGRRRSKQRAQVARGVAVHQLALEPARGRRPASVAMSIGKNVIRTTTAAFDGHSKPNHITMIGATATSGIALVSEASGSRPRCRNGRRSIATPTAKPSAEPSAQPTAPTSAPSARSRGRACPTARASTARSPTAPAGARAAPRRRSRRPARRTAPTGRTARRQRAVRREPVSAAERCTLMSARRAPSRRARSRSPPGGAGRWQRGEAMRRQRMADSAACSRAVVGFSARQAAN